MPRMKWKQRKDREIYSKTFDCNCGDYQHRILFEQDMDYNEFNIQITNGESPLLHRIKVAWRVLMFGTGSFGDVGLKPKEFKAFQEYIASLKPLHDEPE